ncbi:MAG: FliI/YscN family ATPase [Deltaproteobacteria bacterium]|nr:FliI/YscN family ATPase [Deltaproteobacteria bacterium]
MDSLIAELIQAVGSTRGVQVVGKVKAVSDTVLSAVLPGCAVGAFVQIGKDGIAQVAQVEQDICRLVPLFLPTPPDAGTIATLLERVPTIPVGNDLLGRVISPLGIPMDGSPKMNVQKRWAIHRAAPHPFERPQVTQQLVTGVKAIDGLLAIGKGARVGLFAGPGQGKSTLLGMLAMECTCDVAVICLAGERGREAGEFVHRILGKRGLEKSVVVLATSDTPAAQRVLAFQCATAVAEWFRDQGRSVLLLVDSLTRVVRARRDLDLSLGIPAGPGGLAATTLSFLPGLIERASPNAKGSISAVYSVLSETQGDELISSEITSLLDGHILLSKKRADAGKWPAIDVVRSISRVMNAVTQPSHQQLAATIRAVVAAYEENEEMLLMGAYTKGSCPHTDAYLRWRAPIDAFLSQGLNPVAFNRMYSQLEKIAGDISRQLVSV